jgi:hypothetical protein
MTRLYGRAKRGERVKDHVPMYASKDRPSYPRCG